MGPSFMFGSDLRGLLVAGGPVPGLRCRDGPGSLVCLPCFRLVVEASTSTIQPVSSAAVGANSYGW